MWLPRLQTKALLIEPCRRLNLAFTITRAPLELESMYSVSVVQEIFEAADVAEIVL